ncbi:MAG: Cytochrome-c peroxidase [Mucilaginibacter sp.]|nr:Cytochrome-c peroxidase [Mucilaginibacter sp.]
MKTYKHNMVFTGHKSFIILVLLGLITCLSGWSYINDSIETGPYQLVYPANFGNRINVPDDNQTTKQGVYLGRLLFYEKKLSANNTLSCASCHQQDKAFTDGKAFSEGVDHVLTTRNSMSLVNLLWARKFFWDGRAGSLEDQAITPMTNPHEMGQSLEISVKKISNTVTYPALFKLVYGDETITSDRICKAISQFERTLISCNSRYDQYLSNAYQPARQELNGMNLFMNGPNPEKGIRGANCAHCHGGAKTYKELFHNNGLDSIPKDAGIEALTGLAADRGRFKVPTLRNIALTAPYMHDGRFKTLNEVVDHYSDHLKESEALSTFLRGESNDIGGKTLHLRPEEKKDIIAFLDMLTDSTFINDPRFSDPNKIASKQKSKTNSK